MKRKKCKVILFSLLALLAVLLLTIGGFQLYPRIAAVMADMSWIRDLGYSDEEIYDLELNLAGCPIIPITTGENEIWISFDTGTSANLSLTTMVEKDLNYTLIGQTEELNRDGSHRGWSKSVLIDGFSMFGTNFTDVEAQIADWEMYSSIPLNGTIGLDYFASKIITLDYIGQKIAVTDRALNYSSLDPDKYVVIPLIKSHDDSMENLLFFEATHNGAPVSVYLDTGKNYSYLYDPSSAYNPGESGPGMIKSDISIMIGDMELPLQEIFHVNLAQVSDLPNPLMIELNSDQIKKNNLLITIDLIEQKIIFRR